jgi:nucleotide-binding universal stress UspA family protein
METTCAIDSRGRVLALFEVMIEIPRILCPVDFSEPSLRALQHAATLAGWYQSALTALYVDAALPIDAAADVGTFAIAPTTVLEAARSTRTVEDLHRFVARVLDNRRADVEVEEARDVAEAIVRRAVTLGTDLIVIGTHGRTGINRWFVGSVAERVLRDAPCPVMIVPPHDAVPASTVAFKHVVSAVDFSESSLAALRWALSLAEEADAHLWLLHTIEVPPELRVSTVVTDAEIDEVNASARADALSRLRSLIPEEAARFCSIETATTTGEAAHAILKFAGERGADLIVMGAQGHGAFDRFIFGSKTRDVIGGATCPVLTVRK